MDPPQPGREPSEPGWHDTGSEEDFLDAWDDDEGADLLGQDAIEPPQGNADIGATAAAAAGNAEEYTLHTPQDIEQPMQQLEQLQQRRPPWAVRLRHHMQVLLRQHPEVAQFAAGEDATPGETAAVVALLERAVDEADMDDAEADELFRAGGSDGSSGSMTDDEASEEQEEQGEEEETEGQHAAQAGCRPFDPNVAARHQYLGDVDELEGSYGHLPEGTVARLPLLVLDGVVLFPGCQLPLLLNTPQETHLLDRAMAAPPPLSRLLAVLPGPRSLLRSMQRLVCCTAEVRQMRRQSDEGQEPLGVAVLALGRQRGEIVAEGQRSAQSQVSALVRILPEGLQSRVPREMREGLSSIHPALTRPWDLQLLVGQVRQLMQLVLMPAASFQGSPLELSYWVSHNLPLQPATRQLLLMAPSTSERLRLLLELLQRLDRLCCSSCGAQLATTAEVLAMTSEGIGGTFVNSHGYVHEMVTFSKVRGLRLYGGPETAHSWFPGYAWTIAHCGTCGQHMGWRFTATQPGLMPRSFWGLRRPVLLCAAAPNSSNGSDTGEGAADAADAAQLQPQRQGVGYFMRGLGRRGLVIHLGQMPPQAPPEEPGRG